MIDRFSVSFYNQWAELSRQNNWNDFTVINVELEQEAYLGCVEMRVGLLGLNVTLMFMYDTAVRDVITKEAIDIVDKLNQEGPQGRTNG